MRESEVEAYFVRKVKEAGGEVRKVRWIGRAGAPDRFVMFDRGVSIWVELKRPGEKPTAQQAREHTRLRIRGQRVLVIDTKGGVDDFILAMEAFHLETVDGVVNA